MVRVKPEMFGLTFCKDIQVYYQLTKIIYYYLVIANEAT